MIRNIRGIPFFLFVCLLLWMHNLWAYEAVATHVLDGDSFRVRHGRTIQTIRLYGIDCPEYQQTGWRQAKKFTQSMLGKHRLTIQPMDVDRYGRTVALVSVQGHLVNEALLGAGWAWVYRRYCRAQPLCKRFNWLEQNARSGKNGIWRMKKPVPPWVWKHQKKSNS